MHSNLIRRHNFGVLERVSNTQQGNSTANVKYLLHTFFLLPEFVSLYPDSFRQNTILVRVENLGQSATLFLPFSSILWQAEIWWTLEI